MSGTGRLLSAVGVLYGVGPVVIAVVVVAVWELARSAFMPHREHGLLAVAGLAAVGVAAAGGYLAGLNVLVILAAAGLVVSLVSNWRRLGPAARSLVSVLPVGLLATAAVTTGGTWHLRSARQSSASAGVSVKQRSPRGGAHR
jgi:chromate transporter